LLKLASLGWHRGLYGVNQPEQTMPGYKGMSGDHLRASFVKFGEG